MAKTILAKKQPEKALLQWIRKTGGRNSTGKITVRHHGGGYRKLYRFVDFGQEHKDVRGKVAAIEYDPNRSSYIALIQYEDGKKGYVLAPSDLQVGQEIFCAEKTEMKAGNRMQLRHMTVGTMVYNVELHPGRGGKVVRGAGTTAKVLANEDIYTHLQLPSTEIRKVQSICYATVGVVSNPEHMYHRVANAGRMRKMGWRPTVRGSAMNPVDHPHGGGEGRTGIGLKYPKTPTGKHALGVKTRNKKKWTNKLILQRRRKKPRK